MAKKSKKSAPKKSTPKPKAKSKAPAPKSAALKAGARKTVGKNSNPGSSAAPTLDRVLEYKLFTEDSVRSLEDQVNYHLGKGWAPVGGVVVQGQSVFIQTMVRREI
jgi:hypothetical protein